MPTNRRRWSRAKPSDRDGSRLHSVGTRTIVDVLDATTTLYNAKQQLSNARYNYLINELNIKSALGT